MDRPPATAVEDAGGDADQGPDDLETGEVASGEQPEPGVLVAPALMHYESPDYPPGVDGHAARVLLEVLVGADGVPVQAEPLQVDRAQSEVARPFRDAAVAHALSLRFEPATRDGAPIAARVRLEVRFEPEPAVDASNTPVQVPAHHHHGGDVSHAHPAPPAPEADGPQEWTATASVSRPLSAASSVQLRGPRLRLSPFRGTDDLLNAAPGFYAVKHGGGGKAAQYFLRGFDADHGTDVAFRIDGVPENHVSHGHGQGFTNLNWVIPETIDQVRVRKGPYFADAGDFATAGVVDMELRDGKAPSFVSGGAGTFGTLRGVALLSPQLDDLEPLLAAEVVRAAGFFDIDEELLRVNGLARVGRRLGHRAVLTTTLHTHVSDWRAPGQIPLREVRAGRLSRFGSLDENEGGQSARHALTARLRAEPADEDGEGYDLRAYAVASRLSLYSNFTFLSRDTVDGDMIRQSDSRSVLGLDGRYVLKRRVGPFALRSLLGLQLRRDRIDNTLADAPARQIDGQRVDAAIDQSTLGLFAEQRASYHHYLRVTLGLRGDVMSFAVDDRLGAGDDATSTGEESSSRASPKAGLVVTPLSDPEWLALFFNLGYGFHSNDARGVVPGSGPPVTAMTPALGYEVGARARLLDRLSLTGVAFLLDLDSELIWVGDEGNTEAGARTRRMGLEAELELEALRWLDLVVDATLVEARLRDAPGGEDAIPLAPRLLLQAAAWIHHRRSGLSGRLGATHVGDRPATEDEFLTAKGFTRLDVTVRYDHERFALALSASHLLSTAWRPAQFATPSRREGEAAGSVNQNRAPPASESPALASPAPACASPAPASPPAAALDASPVGSGSPGGASS